MSHPLPFVPVELPTPPTHDLNITLTQTYQHTRKSYQLACAKVQCLLAASGWPYDIGSDTVCGMQRRVFADFSLDFRTAEGKAFRAANHIQGQQDMRKIRRLQTLLRKVGDLETQLLEMHGPCDYTNVFHESDEAPFEAAAASACSLPSVLPAMPVNASGNAADCAGSATLHDSPPTCSLPTKKIKSNPPSPPRAATTIAAWYRGTRLRRAIRTQGWVPPVQWQNAFTFAGDPTRGIPLANLVVYDDARSKTSDTNAYVKTIAAYRIQAKRCTKRLRIKIKHALRRCRRRRRHSTYYAFDINELRQWLAAKASSDASATIPNPYTNAPFAKRFLTMANHRMNKLGSTEPGSSSDTSILTEIEPTLEHYNISIHEVVATLILCNFHVTDQMFATLDDNAHVRWYEKAEDIWNYRMPLSIATKRQICPGYEPSTVANVDSLFAHRQTMRRRPSGYAHWSECHEPVFVRCEAARVMLQLLSATDRAHRWQGAIIIMCALTEVSDTFRNDPSLEWCVSIVAGSS